MEPNDRRSLRIILVLFVSVVIPPACASKPDNSFLVNREENGVKNMSSSVGECKIDRIRLSQKMISFIFDDINATYS